MPNALSPEPSFSPRRRWAIASHVLLSLAALLAILLMANYLAARHFRRLEWTSQSADALSPLTLRVLGSLTNPVKIVVFFDRQKPLYSSVKDLLIEYERRCPRIQVEHVDYVWSPARAQVVLDHYRLALGQEADRIIVDAGGKTRVVYGKDLSQYDSAALFRGEPLKRTAFNGEQLITAAIYSVIDPRPLVTYFVAGHGERDPTDESKYGYLDSPGFCRKTTLSGDSCHRS
jgi:hypothetical protein